MNKIARWLATQCFHNYVYDSSARQWYCSKCGATRGGIYIDE